MTKEQRSRKNKPRRKEYKNRKWAGSSAPGGHEEGPRGGFSAAIGWQGARAGEAGAQAFSRSLEHWNRLEHKA